MSNTNEYIITTIKSGSLEYVSLNNTQVRAPFSIAFPSAISIRQKCVPYVMGRTNSIDMYKRSSCISCIATDGPWVAGKVGNYALEFDGDYDVVESTKASHIQFGNAEAFSISCWVKADSSTSNQQGFISSLTGTEASKVGYALGLSSDGTSHFEFVLGAGGSGITTVRASTMNDGNWNHIVGTYDGDGTARIYVNKTLEATNAEAQVEASNCNIALARHYVTCSSVDYWTGSPNLDLIKPLTGTLDEIAIWSGKLGQEAINALNAGVRADTISSSTLQLYYDFEGGPCSGPSQRTTCTDHATAAGVGSEDGTLHNFESWTCCAD